MIRDMIRNVLIHIAKRLPKNKETDYPQLWFYMPKRWIELKEEYPNGQKKLKRAKLRVVIEKLYGIVTGHELSDTEYGYGGGNMIDRNCRWCDKSIQIPIKENIVSNEFKDMMGQVGTVADDDI